MESEGLREGQMINRCWRRKRIERLSPVFIELRKDLCQFQLLEQAKSLGGLWTQEDEDFKWFSSVFNAFKLETFVSISIILSRPNL